MWKPAITLRVSDDTKLLWFTSLRWPEIITKRTSVTNYMKVLFEPFYKNKASHHKQRQLNWYSLSLFNLSFSYSFYTLLLSTMVSVSHIYFWQIARLHCFCLRHAQGMLYLGKFVQIPKQTFRRTRALFSDKTRCFSQSERACVVWKLYYKYY